MTPKELVREWIRRFNAADVEELAELYAPDAVNHQVVTDPLHGREAIRQMFSIEFGRATMVCIEENLFESGDWLSWNGATPSACADVGSFRSRTIGSCFSEGTSINSPFSNNRGSLFPKSIWTGDS